MPEEKERPPDEDSKAHDHQTLTTDLDDRNSFHQHHGLQDDEAFDENLPHEAGSHTNEMRAALPVQVLIASQFQVGLMDESRWLERVTRPFVAQIVPSEPAQLVHH